MDGLSKIEMSALASKLAIESLVHELAALSVPPGEKSIRECLGEVSRLADKIADVVGEQEFIVALLALLSLSALGIEHLDDDIRDSRNRANKDRMDSRDTIHLPKVYRDQ